MNLSKNERRLLVVLVVVLVLGLGFSLLILPQMKKLTAAGNDLLEKQAQRLEMQLDLAEYETIDKQLEEALADAQSAGDRFFDVMTAYELDMKTDSMLAPYGIAISDMNISGPEEISLTLYGGQPGETDRSALGKQLDAATQEAPAETGIASAPAEADASAPALVLRTVTVQYTAAYGDLRGFLDSVTGSGRTVYVSRCEVNGIEGGQINGVMELKFYQL